MRSLDYDEIVSRININGRRVVEGISQTSSLIDSLKWIVGRPTSVEQGDQRSLSCAVALLPRGTTAVLCMKRVQSE